MTSQVLIVGAGPAGSVAATVLARAGVRVTLLEKQGLPRPKTCGDALIPDSLRALQRLGLSDAVSALGQETRGVRVYAPNGRYVDVEGRSVCVPRERFDHLLVRAAVDAGARLVTGADVLGYEAGAGGARVEARLGGRVETLPADLVILATGASSRMMARFGLHHRSTPSALALRRYYRLRPDVDESMLHIWYETPVLPGYAWMFPVGDGVFNVGAGVFRSGRPTPNLRELFDRFRGECEAAREMLDGATPLGRESGAPLRTDLVGCQMTADRLLVAGEALGSTYAFSGEGIGKAMETAAVAAEEALRALERGAFAERDLASYRTRLSEDLAPRYRRYARAQRWLQRPAIVNLVVWRASRSPKLRARLSDILNERVDPTGVLSLRGVTRALIGR